MKYLVVFVIISLAVAVSLSLFSVDIEFARISGFAYGFAYLISTIIDKLDDILKAYDPLNNKWRQ